MSFSIAIKYKIAENYKCEMCRTNFCCVAVPELDSPHRPKCTFNSCPENPKNQYSSCAEILSIKREAFVVYQRLRNIPGNKKITLNSKALENTGFIKPGSKKCKG